MRIFVKPIMGRARQICFRNLKLLLKNVVKPKVGYNCYSTPMVSMKNPIKIIEIFAVASDES